MAIYHLHVKNISRRFGRSALAAAAYRAGETLPNDAEEKLSAFGGRRDVLFTDIRLPVGAPPWMAERARLWNAVEAAEKRKDARLAKEIEFSIPRELPPSQWREVAGIMADAYAAQGYVADFAVHDDGNAHNPHVHIMLTTRQVSDKGFGGKIRAADNPAFVNEARSLWEGVANRALEKAGASATIDARSNRARGLDRPGSGHRGPDRLERLAKRHGIDLKEFLRMSEGRLTHDPYSFWQDLRSLVESNAASLDEGKREQLNAALNRFENELTADRARSQREGPFPDPDGNPISPQQRDDAERAMLGQAEDTVRSNERAPLPDRPPAEERAAAEAAMLRMADLEATGQHESYRLDAPETTTSWLRPDPSDDSGPVRQPSLNISVDIDQDDWLKDELRAIRQEELGPDRDREQDRPRDWRR